MMRWIPGSSWIGTLVVVLALTSGVGSADQVLTPKPRVEVGQAAPDFELPTVAGSTLGLESLRDKSSLILIFFRGAW